MPVRSATCPPAGSSPSPLALGVVQPVAIVEHLPRAGVDQAAVRTPPQRRPPVFEQATTPTRAGGCTYRTPAARKTRRLSALSRPICRPSVPKRAGSTRSRATPSARRQHQPTMSATSGAQEIETSPGSPMRGRARSAVRAGQEANNHSDKPDTDETTSEHQERVPRSTGGAPIEKRPIARRGKSPNADSHAPSGEPISRRGLARHQDGGTPAAACAAKAIDRPAYPVAKSAPRTPRRCLRKKCAAPDAEMRAHQDVSIREGCGDNRNTRGAHGRAPGLSLSQFQLSWPVRHGVCAEVLPTPRPERLQPA